MRSVRTRGVTPIGLSLAMPAAAADLHPQTVAASWGLRLARRNLPSRYRTVLDPGPRRLSLTRDIPTGFGWLIGPFVSSIP